MQTTIFLPLIYLSHANLFVHLLISCNLLPSFILRIHNIHIFLGVNWSKPLLMWRLRSHKCNHLHEQYNQSITWYSLIALVFSYHWASYDSQVQVTISMSNIINPPLEFYVLAWLLSLSLMPYAFCESKFMVSNLFKPHLWECASNLQPPSSRHLLLAIKNVSSNALGLSWGTFTFVS